MAESGLLEYRPGEAPLLRRLSRRRIVQIVVALVLVLFDCFAILWSTFFVSSQRVKRNLHLARAHIPLVERAIAGDPRFGGVRFVELSGSNGSLFADGVVDSVDDLKVVQERVAATNPPRPVRWGIVVRGVPTSRATN